MRLLLNFPDSALYRCFILVDLTLGKIKFLDDFVAWVVIDAKEKLVKLLVEDYAAVAWYSRLVIQPKVVLKLNQLWQVGP